jgi:predicted RNA-binding Zn ribbon-like protein
MSDVEQFVFAGERLWLDFVNTEIMVQGRRVDLLPDAGRAMAWLRAVGLGDVMWPEAEMERLHAFRGTLRDLAGQLACGNPVPAAALEEINTVLASREGHHQVVPLGGSYQEQDCWELRSPLGILAPVAEDVARLLCDGDPALVKKCENPNCILYFYDTSKNHTRRWHSMATCGNRSKAATHYRRTRQKVLLTRK